MRFMLNGALPCLLVVQAAAQAPLTFEHIRAKARPAPDQWRAEALLAEHQVQLQETRGFLREGATLALSAGPRRGPASPVTTDKGFEVDLQLFLASRVRADLESSLGKAHPLLMEAARREGAFRLRAAYLDAWLAERSLVVREADLATVEQWLQAARVRFDAGADPAFQVSLVEGERLKLQQDLDEARGLAARAWGTLAALADVPSAPVALGDPGPVPPVAQENLLERLKEGPLRKALAAQAELEERGVRLSEALASSRWSLRGSYAQEGEENVTRIGLAIRLPRRGETTALRHRTETQLQTLQGESRMAEAELEARALGAAERLRKAPADADFPMDFSRALAAVGLRLQEGRERPSEALPIRRQLLEAQMASLRRTHARHLLAAELLSLLPEVNP